MNAKLYIVVCGERDNHYPLYAIKGHTKCYDTERIPNLSIINSVHTYFDKDMHINHEYNDNLNTIFDNSKVKLYTKKEAKKIIKEIKNCNFLNEFDKKSPKMIEVVICGDFIN